MKKAQTSEPKALTFAFLLSWEKGPLGQWPSSYSVKKCPGDSSLALVLGAVNCPADLRCTTVFAL